MFHSTKLFQSHPLFSSAFDLGGGAVVGRGRRLNWDKEKLQGSRGRARGSCYRRGLQTGAVWSAGDLSDQRMQHQEHNHMLSGSRCSFQSLSCPHRWLRAALVSRFPSTAPRTSHHLLDQEEKNVVFLLPRSHSEHADLRRSKGVG